MGLFKTAQRIANLSFQIDLDESCDAPLRAVRILFFLSDPPQRLLSVRAAAFGRLRTLKN